MTLQPASAPPDPAPPAPDPGGVASWRDYLKLARPTQWAKGAFVVVGPLYGGAWHTPAHMLAIGGAVLAMSLASSGCYVMNDIRDREVDAQHPRKRLRPIASGRIGVAQARIFAVALWLGAAGGVALAALGPGGLTSAGLLGVIAALYIANVTAYSEGMKRIAILDVISLALGFVLRVLAGCAVVLIEPSSWLLNVVFFLAMFLAFGKRLGERRTMGPRAAAARAVQSAYTDDLLRMAVVVTAVATLLTYAAYTQSQDDRFRYMIGPAGAGPDAASGAGFAMNLLWLTVLPATYGLLRCIVLLERGRYDDPTVLVTRDRPTQAAVALFGLLTAGLLWTHPAPRAEAPGREHDGDSRIVDPG
ncbi:MAG: UbiA prenyltransferase family protein [Phycisphaerales bacterium JB039]